jgi:two-component system sensor histidine kinase MprB
MGAAVAVALVVAIASVAGYAYVRKQLYNQVDDGLRRQASQILTAAPHAHSLDDLGLPNQRSSLRGAIIYQLLTPDGNVVGGDTGQEMPYSPADLALAAGQRGSSIRTIHTAAAGGHARVLTVFFGTVVLLPSPTPQNVALQLATPLHSVDRTLGDLAAVLILVSIGGIVMALFLGYLVARTSLRPVRRLTAAAAHVAATQDLNAQIEVTGDDELSRLAASFNAMLAALSDSRHQQAALVADAGHELRTPLTSLRTNIEVLIKMRDLPEADRQALLADVTAQLEELTTLVGDLVELAREDEQKPEPQDVRLDVVVERALERARRRAAWLPFDAYVEPALVRGQPALLERAVLNVLDNAAKWSPAGAHVEVALQRDGSNWRLSVRDHGPGIAPEDVPHIFDRFYRAANARALPGSGLGLAIVNQVVQSHGGWVAVYTPPDGGTLITLSIPSLDVAGQPPTDAPHAPGWIPQAPGGEGPGGPGGPAPGGPAGQDGTGVVADPAAGLVEPVVHTPYFEEP